MLHVQCPGCMTQVFLECTCPAGFVAATGGHQPGCSHSDVDRLVRCPPEADGCCQEDHDHAAAANACPGGHDDPCPHPAGACAVWKGATADTLHPLHDGDPAGPCPGGHCHKDIEGCGVCRPLVITMMPGTTIALAGAS